MSNRREHPEEVHQAPERPCGGATCSSPNEVVARHMQDNTVNILATNNITLSQPHAERHTHVVKALKSVAALLCEQLPAKAATETPPFSLHRSAAGTPCFDSNGLQQVLLKPCSPVVGRSVGFHGQERSRSPTASRGSRSHRCHSACPSAVSANKSVTLAARMRPHTASPTRSSHYTVGIISPAVAQVPFDTAPCAMSQGAWETRAQQRMRINTLVQSVAREKERAEAGKLSQEQMRKFWETNASVHSNQIPTSGTTT